MAVSGTDDRRKKDIRKLATPKTKGCGASGDAGQHRADVARCTRCRKCGGDRGNIAAAKKRHLQGTRDVWDTIGASATCGEV